MKTNMIRCLSVVFVIFSLALVYHCSHLAKSHHYGTNAFDIAAFIDENAPLSPDNTNKVKILLTNNPELKSASSDGVCSLLVMKNDVTALAILHKLLNYKEINTVSLMTPAFYAIISGTDATIEYLNNETSCFDTTLKDRNGHNILHYIARERPEVATKIFKKWTFNSLAAQVCRDNLTPFDYAVICNNHSVIQLFKSYGYGVSSGSQLFPRPDSRPAPFR
jgi:hypothetical protein